MRFKRPKYFLFILMISIFFEYTFVTGQDSTKIHGLRFKQPLLPLMPIHLQGDSIPLQFNYLKHNKLNLYPNIIDLHEYMPPNHLFWDYRESSYYTPWYVKEKIARIMDRPMPNEVLPIYPLALIAAKVALQRLKIEKLIAIKPEDYLLPKKYWPILKAIWEKHPQTAFQLYQIKEIQQGHTMESLKNDLQFLVEHKLLKPKVIPKHPTLYFPGQSRGKAILLLEHALQDSRYSLVQKKQWLDFKNYLINDE